MMQDGTELSGAGCDHNSRDLVELYCDGNCYLISSWLDLRVLDII